MPHAPAPARDGRASHARPYLLRLLAVLVIVSGSLVAAPWALADGDRVTVTGELEVVHEDYFQKGFSRHEYFLNTREGRLALNVAGRHPDHLGGRRVKVRGLKTGRTIDVETLEAEGAATGDAAAGADAAAATGTRKVAVLLMNFTNDRSRPWTKEQFNARMFGTTGETVNAYYTEQSFGKLAVTGIVSNWIEIADTNENCTGNEADGQRVTYHWADLADAGAKAQGIDVATYDHVVYAFPKSASCPWGGLGNLPGRRSWTNGYIAGGVVEHELGHNFGVHHASSKGCGTATLGTSCSVLEYGDPFDVMGKAWMNRHMNVFHKAQLGWLSVPTIATSGAYTLYPLERSSTGLLGLRIARGTTGEYLYVEFRRPFGLFDDFATTDPAVHGVTIRTGPDYSSVTQSFVLDTTPSAASEDNDFDDAPLAVGKTFTDSANGITIKTMSVSSTSASVQVGFAKDAPHVTGFTPTTGVAGTNVTITGDRFTGATSVKFAGVAARYTVSSDTSIAATVPAGAMSGKISVTNAVGTATSTGTFTVPVAITRLSPSSGPVGTVVSVYGTGFTGATAVKFNGVAATNFTVLSSTWIKATVPAGATTGTVSVATPSGTAPSPSAFTITPSLPPTISSFSPTSGPTGTTVTVIGTYLSGASAVTFNGLASRSVTLVSASQLKAVVPNGATAGKVAVTTPVGTASSTGAFTPTVSVTGMSPSSGPVGTSVVLSGVGFTGATAVKFNGVAASYVVVSATSIRATVPSGATTGAVTVTVPAGTVASRSSYVVTASLPPTISGFTPTSGATGTSVTLTGTYFSGASAVKFNGVAAVYTIVSATSIRATVPNGATTGKIAVTTAVGTATSASDFGVTRTITSLSPTSGPVGTIVTIAGKGFTGTTAVKFNGLAASAFSVVSDTSIRATVPSGATSGSVSVTTSAGTVSSPGVFTVTP